MGLYTETTGSGRPLVLLHGWGMNAAVWQPLLPILSREWRVTLVELPGHGDSDSLPLDSSMDDWADACLQAAPPQAIWMGWSLGAQIALQAALREPQRLTALVMLAGTPCFVHRSDWPCGMAEVDLQQFGEALTASPVQTLMRFLGLQVRGSQQPGAVLRQLKASLSMRPAASAHALLTGLQLLLQTDQRSQLHQLETPSLWLYGEQDKLVTAATAGCVRLLRADAKIEVIDGAGHAPFLSHGEQCMQALESLND
ncbi:MAG: pimeloyl-ACP methyl ester esterase BioH [Gammaproteobacteria bacterium]|nr:pimeloyl-ACP methyl ester esterase BioH [Gammaproteobacteria bacterium]